MTKHRGSYPSPSLQGGKRPARAYTYNKSQTARARSAASSSKGGYSLRKQRINFNDRRFYAGSRIDATKKIITLAIIIVLMCLLAVGAVFLLKGCNADRSRQEVQNSDQTQKVSANIPKELSDELSVRLAQNDKLAWIAQHADQYKSPRTVELALNQSAAIDFVYNLPKATHEDKPYEEALTKGTFPQLYTWDERWGYMDYNGMPLGVCGSGPVSYAMAYMGLTGKAEKSPSDIARLALDGKYVDDQGHTSSKFFVDSAKSLGLECKKVERKAEDLSQVLAGKTPVLVHLKKGKRAGSDHWALAAYQNEDTSVVLLDPVSTENSSHPWDPHTIVEMADEMYQVTTANSSK